MIMNELQCYETLDDDVDTWIAHKTGEMLSLAQWASLKVTCLVSQDRGKTFSRDRIAQLDVPEIIRKRLLGLVLMNNVEASEFCFAA